MCRTLSRKEFPSNVDVRGLQVPITARDGKGRRRFSKTKGGTENIPSDQGKDREIVMETETGECRVGFEKAEMSKREDGKGVDARAMSRKARIFILDS
jgi:hypothetical protein